MWFGILFCAAGDGDSGSRSSITSFDIDPTPNVSPGLGPTVPHAGQ